MCGTTNIDGASGCSVPSLEAEVLKVGVVGDAWSLPASGTGLALCGCGNPHSPRPTAAHRAPSAPLHRRVYLVVRDKECRGGVARGHQRPRRCAEQRAGAAVVGAAGQQSVEAGVAGRRRRATRRRPRGWELCYPVPSICTCISYVPHCLARCWERSANRERRHSTQAPWGRGSRLHSR